MNNLDSFRRLGLSDNIINTLIARGFEKPSPIQEQTIPIILEQDDDLVGQAQTGTGKTAAFGLPMLDLLHEKSKKVQALILAPTRELAIQISEELNSFKGSKKLHIVPIYGGQSIDQQLKKLGSGVDIVVGTPGRVIDHINRKTLKLDSIDWLVLDEADEMLKMGFIDEVEQIMQTTNPEKRTLMFCATMPQEILSLAKRYMKRFELVKIENNQLEKTLTDQIYFEVEESDKFEALCRIIDYENDFYGFIFCRTKLDVDSITNRLIDRGYDAEAIHGDITQAQREKTLTKFRNKRVTILVATDVAARGIDVKNLTHVINYALPQDAESYVHRVGRTGRAGSEGTAITFVTRREARLLIPIQKLSKVSIRRGKLPEIHDVIASKKQFIKEELFRIAEEGEIDHVYNTFAKEMMQEKDAQEILASLLKYSFKDELDVKNYREIKEVKPFREYNDRDARDSGAAIKSPTRLFIAMGKKDGMTKRSIVELIKEKAKTRDSKINDVQVFDTYSFITVPFQEAEIILKVFKSLDKTRKRPIVEKADDKQSGFKKESAEPTFRKRKAK